MFDRSIRATAIDFVFRVGERPIPPRKKFYLQDFFAKKQHPILILGFSGGPTAQSAVYFKANQCNLSIAQLMTINRGYYGNLAFRSLGVGKSDNEGGKATHPYSLIQKILRLPCIMRSSLFYVAWGCSRQKTNKKQIACKNPINN